MTRSATSHFDQARFMAGLPGTLATARLRLVTPALEHVPQMAKLANNRAVFDMLRRLPHPYEEHHAVEFVTEMARSPETHAFAILDDKGDYLGVISVMFLKPGWPELGYWLGQPFWGRGYATEAARAVVEAVRALGAPGMIASARIDNPRSRRVLAKAGFVEIGQETVEENGTAKTVTRLEQDFSR